MTKREMVNYIMATVEGRSCGYAGSRSYCEQKKYLEKLNKSELQAEYHLIRDGEDCNFEA